MSQQAFFKGVQQTILPAELIRRINARNTKLTVLKIKNTW